MSFTRSVSSVFADSVSSSTFFIDTEGALFALGDNSYHKLGIGNSAPAHSPTRVPSFAAGTILMVTSGVRHTLFLTAIDRGVYGCGSNWNLQLGDPNRSVWHNPVRLKYFDEKFVSKVVAGEFCSYCLTCEGKIYAFGNYTRGQLGIGRNCETSLPTLVEFPSQVRIVDITTGGSHVAALSIKGVLYTFGANDYRILARDGNGALPRRIGELRGMKFREVLCTQSNMVASASSNALYRFGPTSFGEEVDEYIENVLAPQRIKFFETHPLKTIRVGSQHAICILASGEICVFGWNHENQLIFTDKMNRNTPVIVPPNLLEAVGGYGGISNVYCGELHTLFLTKEGNCFGVGHHNAFGTTDCVQTPELVMTGVASDRRDMHDHLFIHLERYILKELSLDISLSKRSTDSIITIVDSNGQQYPLLVNKEFVALRFGQRFRTVRCLRYSEDVQRRILHYIYVGSPLSLGIFSDPPRMGVEECMAKLFARRKNSEVTLTNSSGDVQKAHLFVLVARREYFRLMFKGYWTESMTLQVELDLPLGAPFEKFLEYLYTGVLRIQPDDAEEFSRIIHYFDEGSREDQQLSDYCCRMLSGRAEES